MEYNPSRMARRCLAGLLVGSSLAAAAPAWAQAEPDTSAQGPEITVVTTRNRVERLQDVPLTVSAITGEQLAKEGIRDLKDIADKVPGLIINGGGSEYLTRPSIRGLPSIGTEPTVATFYDGAYLYNPSATNVMLLDMDRVEVVKGPVNSLYGRSAYAGAINYISAVPTDKFEGRLTAGAGNDGQWKAQGVVNIPIVPDVLMVRASAGIENYDGGWKDSENGLKQGGFQKRAGQLSVLWNVSDAVTASGRIYYANDKFDMNPVGFMDPNCGSMVSSFSPFTHLSYTCGKYQGRDLEVLPESQADGVYGNHRKMLSSFFKLNIDTGFGDVTATTTYTNVKQSRFQDFVGRRDGLPFGLVTLADAATYNVFNNSASPLFAGKAPIAGTINLPVFFGNVQNDMDIAQEVRFQSKADKPVRISAGIYAAYLRDYQETIAGIDGSSIPDGYTITGNATTCLLFVCDRTFLTDGVGVSDAATIGRVTSTIWSGFAGVEFDPFAGLTVSLDGRYTSDRRDLDTIQSNSAFTINDVLGDVTYTYRPAVSTLNPTGAPVHKEFNYFSGRGSIRYKIDADRMVYATVANGVKVGGFNARATHSDEQAYGNEKNMTYEVGFKSSFLNNMLQFNLAGYYIKIKDIQQNGPSSYADTAGLITTNVGGATSKGFEAEATVRPAHWLTLTGGLGYADASFDGGTYDYSFAATCVSIGATYCDQSRVVSVSSPQGNRTAYSLKGLQIPGASKWTVSLGGDIDVPVSDEVSLFAGANYRHQSKQYTGTQNIVWWGGLDRVDARLGVAYGNMRVTAYVDNLTNNKTPDNVGLSSNINDLNYIYQYAALPFLRRFGVTAEYKF